MSDVYSSPEQFGLTQFAILEEDAPYQFDMIVVWRDEQGGYWWGRDAGCSCPSPFEDFQSKESLNQLRADTLTALVAEVDRIDVGMTERLLFIDKIQQAVSS